jgi:hypothetical protein
VNFRQYNPLYNFIWFQSIWFVAVLGGDNWVIVLFSLLICHFFLVENVKTEIKFLVTGAAIGIAVDILLTIYDFYVFNPERSFFIFPLWMIAIWLGFCGTIRHSMKFMTSKPVAMIIVAFFVAPISYVAASKLGAVEFPKGLLFTALIIGFSWMAITACLLVLNNYFASAAVKHTDADETSLDTH